jgi:hypothetical protein
VAFDLFTSHIARKRVRDKLKREPHREACEGTWTVPLLKPRSAIQQLLLREEHKFLLVLQGVIIGTKPVRGKI